MAQLLMFVQLFNLLFPLVQSVVRAVEDATPEGVKGAQKLDAALGAINKVVSAAPEVAAKVEAIHKTNDPVIIGSSVGKLVELSVAIFNGLGVFRKAEQGQVVSGDS